MLIFWIIAVLLVLLALWFVVPPLLQAAEVSKRDQMRTANVLIYRDQYQELEADLKNGLISDEQYQQDTDELERRLLEDVESPEGSPLPASRGTKGLAYIVGSVIPVAGVVLYFLVGTPGALKSPPAPAVNAPFAGQQGGPMSQQQIEANVAKLAQRLEQNPTDTEGWIMLGRSYSVLERHSEAAAAYERATKLNDKDANTWTDYAEAQALANGRRLAGKPVEALNRALEIDSKNQRALVMAGSAALETGDYEKAIDYWQRLLTLLPPNSEEALAVSGQLAKAKELAAGRGSR